LDTRIRHGIKGAFFVYTEIVLSRLVAFMVPVLLVRNLTKEEYGIFVLIPSLLLIVAYVSNFGLEDVITRYIPEYRKKNAPRRVNKLFFSVTLIRVATLILILAILFLFKNTVTDLLNAPPLFESMFLLILLFLGLSRINYLIGDTFTSAYKQRHYVSVMRILAELLRLALFSLVIWRGGGIYGIVLAMVGYRLLELLAYLVLDVRKAAGNFRLYAHDTSEPLGNEFKRISRFGVLSFFSRGFHGFRNITIDNLIIAYFLSPVAVATYGLAAFFPNFIRSFAPSRMLGAVLLPMMIDEYVKDKDTPFLGRIHRFTQKLNMFLLFPMAAGILLLA
jgi:O-antigen/teichoic acid export membrane protein